MKLRQSVWTGCVLGVFVALAGCGGDAGTGGDGGAGGDSGTGGGAIPSTPLAGTIGGRAFASMTALAQSGGAPDGMLLVSIYERAVTCATMSENGPEGDRSILVVAPWMAGASFDVGLDRPVTFVTRQGAVPQNTVVTTGRVEVVAATGGAGDAGTGAGTLRLRASNGGDTVQGEVSVTVCP